MVERAVVEEQEKIKDTEEFATAERARQVAVTLAEKVAEEALVNELRGRAILRRSRQRGLEEGSSLILKARDLYQMWGAEKRVRQMDAILVKSI